MVLRIFQLVICVLLITSCSSNEDTSGQSEEREEIPGKLLYEERCVQCHGFDGTDCLAGAADLSSSKMVEDSIRILIKNGKGAMPPFSSFIESETDMDELINYVTSLRK